jgi:hypothetical protein
MFPNLSVFSLVVIAAFPAFGQGQAPPGAQESSPQVQQATQQAATVSQAATGQPPQATAPPVPQSAPQQQGQAQAPAPCIPKAGIHLKVPGMWGGKSPLDGMTLGAKPCPVAAPGQGTTPAKGTTGAAPASNVSGANGAAVLPAAVVIQGRGEVNVGFVAIWQAEDGISRQQVVTCKMDFDGSKPVVIPNFGYDAAGKFVWFPKDACVPAGIQANGQGR